MEIDETCRKLKPVIGKKSDAYWLAYTTATTPAEKQEIAIALNILAAKHLNTNYEDNKILLTPPLKDIANGLYKVGKVVYNEKGIYPFGLREDEWIQHVGIFGRSGAGKTNLALNIIDSLLAQKKPFLIFDWKRNYRDLLTLFPKENIRVYTVGRDVSPIQFNPLIPPYGTPADTWLKKLIEIIATTYYVGEGVISLLLRAIDSVYKEFGVYDGCAKKWPTMLDVLSWLKSCPVKGREQNWLTSTLRAVIAICYGEMGRIVNVNQQFPISELLKENVVLELDSLTSSDKTFLIESLLLWIYHFRMAEQGRETFKHVILIEEAHHILAKQAASSKEGITDVILREIRELGESIILLDQLPSLITPTALANTNCTFTFNLKNRSCVTTAANYTLIGTEDKDCFGRLPVGYSIVKLQGRWFQPFLIKIPWIRIKKGSVTDTMLRQFNRDSSIDSGPNNPEETDTGSIPASLTEDKGQLSNEAIKFLQDVLDKPVDGVSKRYSRLGLSRRKGNEIKGELLTQSLIREVSIPLSSGRVVLLEATDKINRIINSGVLRKGKSLGKHSPEHEFWKEQVRKAYESKGYSTDEEHPVNGFIDLIAIKGEAKLFVEIETGKSDIQANVEKAKGMENVIFVATNGHALNKIKKIMASLDKQTVSRISLRNWKEFY